MRASTEQLVSATAPSPLGLSDAVAIAVREIERLGLADTHYLGGLYAAPDAHTEGAEFAATVLPRPAAEKPSRRRMPGERWKLLIQCNGDVSVCPFGRRCTKPCKAAGKAASVN